MWNRVRASILPSLRSPSLPAMTQTSAASAKPVAKTSALPGSMGQADTLSPVSQHDSSVRQRAVQVSGAQTFSTGRSDSASPAHISREQLEALRANPKIARWINNASIQPPGLCHQAAHQLAEKALEIGSAGQAASFITSLVTHMVIPVMPELVATAFQRCAPDEITKNIRDKGVVIVQGRSITNNHLIAQDSGMRTLTQRYRHTYEGDKRAGTPNHSVLLIAYSDSDHPDTTGVIPKGHVLILDQDYGRDVFGFNGSALPEKIDVPCEELHKLGPKELEEAGVLHYLFRTAPIEDIVKEIDGVYFLVGVPFITPRQDDRLRDSKN